MSLFLQYFAQIIFGADPKVFPNLINDQLLFEVAGIPIKTFDVTIHGGSLCSMLGLHFLVYHTKMGQAMRAVSHNPAVASILDINVSRTIAFTFIAGSSLAGIGSILVGIKYQKIEPLMGTMIGLKAFVAAVLGGIGSIAGAVVGGLVPGISEVFVVVYGSSSDRVVVVHGPLAPAVKVELVDELGQSIQVPLSLDDGVSEMDVSVLPVGVYTVIVATTDRREAQRVVVRR